MQQYLTNFKWLSPDQEQQLNLKRTNHVIGDSFAQMKVVYETGIDGVYLTNYVELPEWRAKAMWRLIGRNKQVVLSQEILSQPIVFGMTLKEIEQV